MGRRAITDEDVEQVIRLTLERAPQDAMHWSTRSLAKASDLSQIVIDYHRI